MNLEDLRGRGTVSVAEAAEFLGIGPNQGYAAARNGEIPAIKIGGRWLIPVPDLLRMIGAEDEGVATAQAARQEADYWKERCLTLERRIADALTEAARGQTNDRE